MAIKTKLTERHLKEIVSSIVLKESSFGRKVAQKLGFRPYVKKQEVRLDLDPVEDQELEAFVKGETDNLSQELVSVLTDYYSDEMPHEIQKARSGDPYEWLRNKLEPLYRPAPVNEEMGHSSLYQELLGIDATMHHFESDLYVKDSKEVRKVLDEFPIQKKIAQVFASAHDGSTWMEIPSAYEPWHTEKRNNVAKRSLVGTVGEHAEKPRKDNHKVRVECMECGRKFSTNSMNPTCPKCHGTDIDVLEEGLKEDVRKVRIRCNGCGSRFGIGDDERNIKCPNCGEDDFDLGSIFDYDEQKRRHKSSNKFGRRPALEEGPRDLAGGKVEGKDLPGVLPCHDCGDLPTLYDGSYWGYTISCGNCYDGAPDSSNRNEFVDEVTKEQAVDAWNEMQQDIADSYGPPDVDLQAP
jgi:Zn finger protein HypA/HybF involved in hydrogenase expression